MAQPVGIILAGGQARRMAPDNMGGDKSLLKLGERTMLALVIERFSPQVDILAINGNGDRSRFAEFGLEVVPDSIEGFAGPLAGILAGLDWAAARGAKQVISVAADTPFFPLDLSTKLERTANEEGKSIAMAATLHPTKGMMAHPTFGLWSVHLRVDLRNALAQGTRKVSAWAEQYGVAIAEFEFDKIDPFFNVNTPADLKFAKSIIESES